MRNFVSKGSVAGALVGIGLMMSTVAVAADDIAAAGNGGTADASANGGAVALGDINSGGNAGNGIGVGDSHGDVSVGGGSAATATDISASLDGGTAISDASGGDDNIALLDDDDV
ncbi:MAG: hypothetical protein M3464_11145 [Chloroflexota bacterium]|nr:hypothetical protein [Chloroflexota bacterium]